MMNKVESQFNILIVEDSSSQRELLKIAIEQKGIKAYTAKNASEGLRLHAEHPNIKIVFADLNLPGEMNGREMGAIMLEREPRTVIYAFTGYADKFALDDCLRVGFKDYFIKPVDFNELRKLVKCSIDRVERWEKIK